MNRRSRCAAASSRSIIAFKLLTSTRLPNRNAFVQIRCSNARSGSDHRHDRSERAACRYGAGKDDEEGATRFIHRPHLLPRRDVHDHMTVVRYKSSRQE